MKIAKTIASARRLRALAEGPVILVPTMGALHAGHADILRRARSLVGRKGQLIASIFVNPTQFGPNEDYSRYPRTWSQDVGVCEEHRVDWIFAPSAEEMYASDRTVSVDEGGLSDRLCGASRPGHFRGVCTVVAKLFLITQPHFAAFGEKDWQQLAIIERMVRDLNFPIRVVPHPTFREDDGLAMSSRNAYLTAEQREVAPRIYHGLSEAALSATPATILGKARRALEKIPGAKIDYVELVDAATLEPARNLKRPARLAAAVFLGSTRLIDNVAVNPRS